MTPEERVRKIIDVAFRGDGPITPQISMLVREAVAAEREACAKIADDEFRGHPDAYAHIAVAIRARNT